MSENKPSTSFENRVYVGAYGLCLDQQGRLLMARLSRGLDAGRWTLPGGGVLWGEHPEQAIMREMEEETGLDELELGSIAAIYSHVYQRSSDNPLPPMHHLGIIYHLTPTSFDLKIEVGGTTDLCQWLTEAEIRGMPLTPLGEYAVSLAWHADER